MPVSKSLSLLKAFYDFVLMGFGGFVGAIAALYYQNAVGPIRSLTTLVIAFVLIAVVIIPTLFYMRWTLDSADEDQ
jgi:hypothetical protein